MSSRTLYRWSGGTLIVASLLILIGSVLVAVLFPDHSSTKEQVLSFPWLLTILFTLIGSVLFVLGLPGFYLRQAGRAGVLGLVGFVLLFLDMLLQGAIFSAIQVTVLPLLAQSAPQLLSGNNLPVGVFLFLLLLPGLMQIIGSILFGIATMRARVFPRWIGMLFLVAGVAFLLTIPPLPSSLSTVIETASFAALAIACIGGGYLLVADREPAGVEAIAAAPTSIRTGY